MRIALLVLALSLTACTAQPIKPEPPRKSGDVVAPPPGCQQLRTEGGSC